MRADLERLDAPLDLQQQNWDTWNLQARNGAPDAYMLELLDEARRWVPRTPTTPRILEVGCGTGWLTADLTGFGRVTGVDLSPAAIEIARQRRSEAQFVCGDIRELTIDGHFDYVVTADTISHVADQPGFVRRIGDLLKPGGTFLLMTQNEFILGRSTMVTPPGPGHIRHWPTIGELRSMLAAQFTIVHHSSIGRLGGERGLLRIMRARRAWNIIVAGLGKERAASAFGKLGLGSEMVIVARRRA
jgi:2-polyprenyl-3-methyl-5-hydroxy-6-metoxy-1,4-benzoquinol methylase